MLKVKRLALLLGIACACTGCVEFYTLTVPDHVAAAGSEAPVIVRLQQNDLFFVRMSSPDQPIRFQIDDGVERNAHSDKAGYAATLLPMPEKRGFYLMEVNLSDLEGDEVMRYSRTYVWDSQEPVLAVDADFLLKSGNADAVEALNRVLNRGINIIYFTRKGVDDHFSLHTRLEMASYPDGPVLAWKREFYRIEKISRFRARVVVDKQLVSQLPTLRTMFPNMQAGLCDSALAAEAFSEAGMEVLMIGDDNIPTGMTGRRVTWSDLTVSDTIIPGIPGQANEP
jgi:hypothetical protein